MAQADIAIIAEDRASAEINRMEDANSRFNDSLDETQRQVQQYSRRLSHALNEQASLQTSLSAARRELRAAERAFRDSGDAIDLEHLNAANDAYNQIATSLANARQAANDTSRALYNLTEVESRRNSGATADDTGIVSMEDAAS